MDVMERVVYSPHVYGPDVYDHPYFKSTKLKETLWKVRRAAAAAPAGKGAE